MSEEKINKKKMYCGIGPVPKGKIRASPEYCVKKNQIRYYGIKAIDKTLLKKPTRRAPNLLKEQFKLKMLENRAKKLLSEYKTIKLVLEKDNISQSKSSQLEKKITSILNMKDTLIKKLKNQKKIIETIEKEENRATKNLDQIDDNNDNNNDNNSNDNHVEQNDDSDLFEDKMYCGIGPIPKGMIRGTPEYCLRTNQVRYYGIEAIDKNLLKNFEESTSDLLKEQLKMKRIEESAKILIKNIKETHEILNMQDEDSTAYQEAREKMDELQTQKKSIIKKIKSQRKILEKMEKTEKKNKKEFIEE